MLETQEYLDEEEDDRCCVLNKHLPQMTHQKTEAWSHERNAQILHQSGRVEG